MAPSPRPLYFLSFLLFGASAVLQIFVSLGLPFFERLYFLEATDGADHYRFGLWTICRELATGSYTCDSNTLGYHPSSHAALVSAYFGSSLPYSLVVQPISTGLTAITSAGCLLLLVGPTMLWPVFATFSTAATTAALALELVIFVLARDKFDAAAAGSSMLGPSVWLQLGAVVASLAGCLVLWTSVYAVRLSRRVIKDEYDDFAPTPAPPAVSSMAALYPEQYSAEKAAAREADSWTARTRSVDSQIFHDAPEAEFPSHRSEATATTVGGGAGATEHKRDLSQSSVSVSRVKRYSQRGDF